MKRNWRQFLFFIIFAVLLGEIGKVDNEAYNSTFAYLVYMALLTRTDLRINRYCFVADFPFSDPVQTPIIRHRAKFREDRLNRSGDMADFRFFKMAAVRHLGFVLRVLGPPTKSTWWSLLLCKIWL